MIPSLKKAFVATDSNLEHVKGKIDAHEIPLSTGTYASLFTGQTFKNSAPIMNVVTLIKSLKIEKKQSIEHQKTFL